MLSELGNTSGFTFHIKPEVTYSHVTVRQKEGLGRIKEKI
jgi:hypothetical protein